MHQERMTDERRFSTSSLPLAAALLASVPEIVFVEISAEPSIDGRKTIVLQYSADQEATLRAVVEKFHARCLTVSLYGYNKVLNALRDRLFHNNQPHAAIR